MTLDKIKKYAASYPLLYWISVFSVIVLSLSLLLLSNLSGVPAAHMVSQAVGDSEQAKDALSETEKFFASYRRMLNELASDAYRPTDEWLEDFERRADILLSGFGDTFPHVSGYFINLDSNDGYPILQKYVSFADGRQAHISVLMDSSFIYGDEGIYNLLKYGDGAIFLTIPSYLTGRFELAHTAALYINGRFRGIFGITLDMDSLPEMYGDVSGDKRSMALLSENLEIISSTGDLPPGARLESVSGYKYKELAEELAASGDELFYARTSLSDGAWMNIFIKLPTGQVFWEAYLLRSALFSTNILIAFLTAYALLCMWVVQKRGNVSPFDKFSDKFSGTPDGYSGEEKIGMKAWFALHMSLTITSFAQLAFVLMDAKSAWWLKLSYMLLFMYAVFGIYAQLKKGSRTRLYLYILTYMLAPIIIHHLSGGFAGDYAGQVIIFCVFCVALACYAMKRGGESGVFSTLVALLFLNAIFEMMSDKNVEPVFAIRWTTVIFFLAFGIYAITEIYVSETRGLFARLKDAQSAIVKKERMVTLGTLIAGIAHEINTPLSAIKASAEGMELATKSAFKTLLDSGASLGEEDIKNLSILMELELDALKSMYSTTQLRKSKPVLKEFFESLGYQEANTFVERLLRLEICDIEKIRENRRVFESESIGEIMDIAVAVSPIIRGSHIIRQSAARTSKIIFALKSYSHTAPNADPVWFNVTDGIDNALVLLYNQIKGAVKLVKEYDEELPQVYGNPDELGQVWLNIIQNAIHAMKGSGALTLSIKNEGDFLHIATKDTGGGMSPEVLEQVFEPFFTTKQAGEGSGLGLDICKKIVEGHKGAITVESTPGEGTVVHVRLPVNRL